MSGCSVSGAYVKASWYGSSSEPTLAQLARSLAKLTVPFLKIAAFLNASAYAVQALNTPGNAARNSAYGPRQFNTDFSLRKEFRVTETKFAEFRWESFNFFNTTNFGNPATTFGNTNFGFITGAGDGRVMQLGVRFQF